MTLNRRRHNTYNVFPLPDYAKIKTKSRIQSVELHVELEK